MKNKSDFAPVSHREDEITFNIYDDLSSQNLNDQIELYILDDTISIHFYEICKYSQFIQDKYHKNDFLKRFPQYIKEIQQKYNIDEYSLLIFFKLIKEENVKFNSDYFFDLYKLSEIFDMPLLQAKLDNFSQKLLKDPNYIINSILHEKSTYPDETLQQSKLYIQMEQYMMDNIDKFLKTNSFGKLHISLIYRIVEKCSKAHKISIDSLYEFIDGSIEERHQLLTFVEIQKLSDENFDRLCNDFIHRKDLMPINYFQYLPVNLAYIKELKDERDSLFNLANKVDISLLENEITNLKKQKDKIADEVKIMMMKVDESKNIKTRIENEIDEKKKIYEKIEIDTEDKRKENFYLIGQIQDNKNKLNRLLDQLEKTKKQNDELANNKLQLSEITIEVNKMNKIKFELLKEQKEINEKIELMKKELEEYTNELMNVKNEYRKEIDKTEKLQDFNATLVNDMAELGKIHIDLKRRIKRKEKELGNAS